MDSALEGAKPEITEGASHPPTPNLRSEPALRSQERRSREATIGRAFVASFFVLS
jgi:hypothetical protein